VRAGEIKFMDVTGARTRYWEGGEGEPMLLVHAAQFGELCSLDEWDVVLDEPAQSFHVVNTLREVRWTVWEPSIEGKRRETLDHIGREGIPVPTLVVWGATIRRPCCPGA
jgi:hypothetical protein